STHFQLALKARPKMEPELKKMNGWKLIKLHGFLHLHRLGEFRSGLLIRSFAGSKAVFFPFCVSFAPLYMRYFKHEIISSKINIAIFYLPITLTYDFFSANV
uniref:Uncharacterized protein n=1 Tax=Parascaris univalens TaxID=6257 RepID=A0A915BXI6_PARUN